MAAEFPSAVKSFTPIVDGVDYPQATQLNQAYDEITAMAQGALTTASWTPVIGGAGGTSGQTYASQSGRYVRFGNILVATFSVQLSAKGTITGNAQIQGLPVAALSPSGQSISLGFGNLANNFVSVVAEVTASTTTALLTGATAAATSNQTALTTADIANTTLFRGVIVYLVA
jgi:hypothetical protein